jgi:drug/metabolite transporter (DMT)-like permease
VTIDTRGALYAAAAAIFYGSSYVATGVALRSFDPITIAAWRGALAVVLLAGLLALPAFAALRPGRMSRAAFVRLCVLALLHGAVFILAMNAAVEAAGATVTAFVAGLYAVIAALLAVPLLGERIERRTLAALLVALLGTLLLGNLRLDWQTAVGIGLGLVAAVAFGLFLVLSRRWTTVYRLSGPTVAVAAMSAGALAGLLGSAFTGAQLLPDDPRPDAWLALAWLGVGPGAMASVMVVASTRRLAARHASAFLLLNPPTAALLALPLLGQGLSPVQLIGGGCILVAIAAASGLLSAGRSRVARR